MSPLLPAPCERLLQIACSSSFIFSFFQPKIIGASIPLGEGGAKFGPEHGCIKAVDISREFIDLAHKKDGNFGSFCHHWCQNAGVFVCPILPRSSRFSNTSGGISDEEMRVSLYTYAMILSLLLALFSLSNNFTLVAAPVRTPQVIAELLKAETAVEPGKTIWVGLRLEMIPHWHVYWKYPGDSGLATKVQWTLPEGWEISEAKWEIPKRIAMPPLVNYGFEEESLLGFELRAPSNAKGKVELFGKASWLVCKEECIPQKADLSLEVPVGKPSKTAAHFIFEKLKSQQPKSLEGATLVWDSTGEPKSQQLRLGWKLDGEAKGLDFFPELGQVIKGHAPPVWEKGIGWMELASNPNSKAKVLYGILVEGKKTFSVEASIPSEFASFAGSDPSAADTMSDGYSEGSAKKAQGIFWSLLFAFLGGLLLNLMPCVFPVLSLKVLGIMKERESKKQRLHAHLYFLGVVVSFWALTAALLLLRSFGQSVGWGFQLQQPLFVVFLVVLFSLITANLAGFLEVGGRWMGMGSSLTAKNNSAGAFFTGVLAVIVATPCTAPFMGSAMAVVLSEPSPIVFLVFTFLGAGLGAPFVLLTYFPQGLRLLPRPGAWMEKLKVFFAFPMAATVLWLLWVLGLQKGIDGVIFTSLGVLFLFFHFWLWNSFSSVLVKATAVVALLAAAYSFLQVDEVSALGSTTSKNSWESYSPEAVESALASKESVFIDFTAAWCITCQVNKKTVLERPRMLEFFESKKVKLFRADWTNQDPAITAALTEAGSIGVPLYLAYPQGRKPPKQLSQILTEGEVKDAFQNP